MTAAFWVIGAVAVWTAGLTDWIVAYATGIAQLGVWLTLLSLLPMATLWVTLKRQSFEELSATTARAHWSIQLKASSNHYLTYCRLR